MPEDPREYLRAAQEAELRGDKSGAIELLRKAAAGLRTTGREARALQVLRYAQRLDPNRSGLGVEEPSLAQVRGSGPDERQVLAPADAAPAPTPTTARELVERGPVLADPNLNAWCSFCCRPKAEVGPLVAGPAGAFVCRTCAAGCVDMLGGAASAQRGLSFRRVEGGRETQGPPAELAKVPEQRRALTLLQAVLRKAPSATLLIGPEGSGKSTLLEQLERQGLGVRLRTPLAGTVVSAERPVLIDDVDQLDPQDFEVLNAWLTSEPGFSCVATARGVLGAGAFTLMQGELELPLFSTPMLVEASGGKLPSRLLSSALVVVPLDSLGAASLREVARVHLSGRVGVAEVSEDLVIAVAEHALASGRGAGEVAALSLRIPSGTWTPKRPRRASKKRSTRKGHP